MTPTPRLRFVERIIAVPATDGVGKKVRVLQQWWTVTGTAPEFQNHFGEWHDVPLETEK